MTSISTLTREQVLKAARKRQAAAVKAEIDKLVLAVEWAELNPGEPVDETKSWEERELEVAGDGAPTVAEFSIAEFALAVGLTTDAGRVFIGDAVELAHRLPRTWTRVLAGEVLAWKARKVAQQTRALPRDAALFVDRALAPVLHSCSFAQIERTVEGARAEFDPQAAEERRIAAAEQRHLTFYWRNVIDGQVAVAGLLDIADAVALDENLSAKAATLDPALPLDVRRAIAAGMLGAGSDREVVIYTHTRPDQSMVEVENTRTVVTPGQVREWCEQAGTKVTVRPVLDLNESLATDCYEPTERQREQVALRFPRCVFPGCSRSSRHADLDHITEWPRGEHRHVEPRTPVPRTPPAQDLHRLGLRTHRPQDLRLEQPPRPDLPGHREPTYPLTTTPPITVGGASVVSAPLVEPVETSAPDHPAEVRGLDDAHRARRPERPGAARGVRECYSAQPWERSTASRQRA